MSTLEACVLYGYVDQHGYMKILFEGTRVESEHILLSGVPAMGGGLSYHIRTNAIVEMVYIFEALVYIIYI